jgi:hypothetical protein
MTTAHPFRPFAAMLLTAALSQPAAAQRRGAYELTVGPERASSAGDRSMTSMGVDVRLQVAPAPFGSETFKVGVFGAIEAGYAKLSDRFFQGFADSTRMYHRWELGPAFTYHKKQTDISAYVYAMIWDDHDFVDATLGANNFNMLKGSVRHGRILAELAHSLHANINTSGSLIDGSVWLLSNLFAVGLRYQHRSGRSGPLITHNKVDLLSLAVGIIE